MGMTWKETKEYIKRDVYRNLESCSTKTIVREFLFKKSTAALLIHFRLCHYYARLEKRNVLQFLLHGILYLRFQRLQEHCGIELNQRMQIGYGLRLPH